MSKEIKFRWVGRNKKFGDIQINSDLTTKKLLNGSVLSFFSESNRGAEGNCEFLSEDLFTEQKDKSSIDIYVGDILKLNFKEYYSNDAVTVDEESIVIGKVSFENGGFFINEKDSTWYWLDDMEEVSEIEIIGNIYENPELLK